MKKLMKSILPAAGIAAVAAAATIYLVAPGHSTGAQRYAFAGRNYAHRGLHRRDHSIPENSLAAFQAAALSGYGIELDVRLTADHELVVFHDDTLTRMCGIDGRVQEYTLEELQTLSLLQTQETIPTLAQALEVIDGQVPLIIELKRGKQNRILCQQVLEHIVAYPGDVCIESFDPLILHWFKKHAPDIMRGQLTCSMRKFGKSTNPFYSFLVSRGLTNFLSRPQFISHDVGHKSILIRLSESMGALKFCWTSRDWRYEDANDGVIFEHYRPQPIYRKEELIEKPCTVCPIQQKVKDWFSPFLPVSKETEDPDLPEEKRLV
jgi:glycerophosphoryl diester phosphodiesterase